MHSKTDRNKFADQAGILLCGDLAPPTGQLLNSSQEDLGGPFLGKIVFSKAVLHEFSSTYSSEHFTGKSYDLSIFEVNELRPMAPTRKLSEPFTCQSCLTLLLRQLSLLNDEFMTDKLMLSPGVPNTDVEKDGPPGGPDATVLSLFNLSDQDL